MYAYIYLDYSLLGQVILADSCVNSEDDWCVCADNCVNGGKVILADSCVIGGEVILAESCVNGEDDWCVCADSCVNGGADCGVSVQIAVLMVEMTVVCLCR